MTIRALLVSGDFKQLRVIDLSLDLEQEKARLLIYNTTNKVVAFDITVWMWQINGEWKFGWSIERLNNIKTTIQLEEKLKVELQKLLLSYFGNVKR